MFESKTNHIALICGAGQGKRLGTINDGRPKALLHLGEKTILEHMLDVLSEAQIQKVIILIGYRGQEIINLIGAKYKNCHISYVANQFYEITDNLYSMYLARDLVDSGIIFFNADMMFNKELLDQLLDSSVANGFITADGSSATVGQNPVRVSLDGSDGLVDIGHDIGPENDEVAFGMYKLSNLATQKYFSIAEKIFASGPVHAGFWFPLKELKDDFPVRGMRAKSEKWLTVNTPEEYTEAQKRIDYVLSE